MNEIQREPPEGYDGQPIMVSGTILLDHVEHMQDVHDVDEEHAEGYFEDVKTQVMLLEQSIPECDWDDDEIEVITNTLIGFAHQNSMMQEQQNARRAKWVNRLITVVMLGLLGVNIWNLAAYGFTGSIMSWMSVVIVVLITLVFVARE